LDIYPIFISRALWKDHNGRKLIAMQWHHEKNYSMDELAFVVIPTLTSAMQK
jgi:hypothetical protein